MMRLVTACALLVALTVSSPAKEERWTLAYAQGTTEAIIRNARAASVNIYCPSGQEKTTAGIFIETKAVSPRAGEQVAVQFVIDGKRHAFDFQEIQFEAAGPARRNALAALIDALAKSKAKGFVVEFTKPGVSEQFSLAGARKALTSAKDFLDGCE